MPQDLVNYKEEKMAEETKVVEISDRELTPMEELDQWLKELVFPGKVSDFIEDVSNDDTKDEHTRELCFYTDQHCYFIHALVRKDDGDNYIGCEVSARKQRAGEDWTRGNDLPDGPFNKETWNRIVYAIVNYELIQLTQYVKPLEVPEEVA